MATSDSEDFESADEWEDESKIEQKEDEISTTNSNLKTNVKLNQKNTDRDEILCSKHSETVVSKADVIVKNLDKSVSIQDSEFLIDTDKKGTLRSGVSTNISNICHKTNISSEEQKQIDETSERNIELSVPKELKEETTVPEATIPPIETDGWECEDEDFDDDLVEDNSRGSVESVINKLSESVKTDQTPGGSSGGWGAWGGWGVTSILSSATESVSSLTNQVSQGLSTVLESGLGVPNPEELVKQEMEDEKKMLASLDKKTEASGEKQEDGSVGLFGLGRVISGVSSITKLVETASTKVVSGGLDTLETIGKKTMEVLQEGDPGLRKKRAIFSENVVLSQLLREAKEKAEEEDKALKSSQEARKVHFETLFDDYHGLVHLEALEMLSKQSNIKLQSVLLNVPSSEMAEFQESLLEIKELCQRCEDEEPEGASFEAIKSKLAIIGEGLDVPVAKEKFVKTWNEIHHWIEDLSSKQEKNIDEEHDSPVPSAREIYQKAIDSLARLTAESVEQFHKTAELLLVYEQRNPKEEAKNLLDMTSTFSLQVSTAATVFSERLNICTESKEDSETVNSQITNIFLEAANSSSYIQEAFQLLVPVLQVGITLS